MKTEISRSNHVGNAVIRQMWTPPSRLHQKRYSAIVMFIDVVGFSRLMHENEEIAMDKLEIIRTMIERHHRRSNGRIIQYYGDGCLSTFEHADDAIECAIAIQAQTKAEDVLPLRIGIHGGGIVEKDGAIYGDVVNIAARIEAGGSQGAVLVSKFVKSMSLKCHEFQNLGLKKFKNIAAPVPVFAIQHNSIGLPTRSLFQFLSTSLFHVGSKLHRITHSFPLV